MARAPLREWVGWDGWERLKRGRAKQKGKRYAAAKLESGSVARWSRWHFLRACNKSLAVLPEVYKS